MEDEPVTARIVQRWLQIAGFDVEFARDGAAGLAMYAAGDCGAVLVDGNMPAGLLDSRCREQVEAVPREDAARRSCPGTHVTGNRQLDTDIIR